MDPPQGRWSFEGHDPTMQAFDEEPAMSCVPSEPRPPRDPAPEAPTRALAERGGEVPFCGWFESSEDLRRGLEVSELAWPMTPMGAARGCLDR